MANQKQPDKDQLVRVERVPAQVTPPANQPSILRASLAPTQQTETDDLGQLYKGTSLPVIRHAPFSANPVTNAAANSAANNAVSQAIDGLTLPFSQITQGDNTAQGILSVDNGSELIPVNEGTVGANNLFNTDGLFIAPITGVAPTHPGELLISQPDGSAAFADPLVQGLYAEGDSVVSPPAFVAPTTIQPVLTGVSASDTLFALRTSDTFKTFQSQGGTPGQQGIWTPASGKKFRVMKVWISVSGNAETASGGLLTISLTDGMAGNVVGAVFDVWIPPATPTLAGGVFAGAIFDSGWADMGNGYLSTGANQVLFLNTSLQLSSGFVRINVFGTEEA